MKEAYALGVFKTVMEEYISLGSDLIVPEYTLLVSSKDDTRVLPNVIVVAADILHDCPMPHELKENMNKRLVLSNKTRGGPNLAVVAMMCLASRDYSVSHNSVHGVTEKNMAKIWGYLERQVIGSSYQLRQWMRSRVGTRTCEGYMAHWNISRSLGNHISNDVISKDSWAKCVNITNDMANKICGQPEMILEALRIDMSASAKVKNSLNM